MQFFIPLKLPTQTHQEKKVNFNSRRFYEPQELKTVRGLYRDLLIPFVPSAPLNGALRLCTKWCFPISGKHYDGEYRTSKPDTDNLVKMLKDVMTDLKFWNDDAQVASEIIEKFWAKIPGLFISLEVIEP